MDGVKRVSRTVVMVTSEILTLTLAGGLALMFVPVPWLNSLGLF